MDDSDGVAAAKLLMTVGGSPKERTNYRQHLGKDTQYTYSITAVETLEKAAGHCQNKHVDLILLDLPDPVGAYQTLLGELTAQHLTIPPVVVLAADGDEGLAVEVMKLGAYVYLPKGQLTAQVLQMAVRSAVERAQLQQKLETSRERQRLIATTALRIRHSLNLERILETAVAQVRRLLAVDRAIVARIEDCDERQCQVVAESVGDGWPTMLGDRLRFPAIDSDGGRYNWQKWQQVQDDIAAAKAVPKSSALLKKYAVKARMALPIAIGASQDTTGQSLWGLLVVHQCESKRDWHEEEIEALRQLSVQLAIAIQQSQLLDQTRTSLQKEKDLNSLKTQIISTISHEYRTPLTAILTSASTLTEHAGTLNRDMQLRCLNIIEQRARHLAYLVDDMVFASQLDRVKEAFQPCLLDAEQFFSELINERKVAANHSHELILNLEGETEGFCGDRSVLKQVFGNLLSNAIKYSPNGGKIEIAVLGNAHDLQVTISDEGIGIPASELEGLFQEFHRGSNVGTISGTGLGLSIAKSCLELHGGQISITSHEAAGTQVTVTIPKTLPAIESIDLAS